MTAVRPRPVHPVDLKRKLALYVTLFALLLFVAALAAALQQMRHRVHSDILRSGDTLRQFFALNSERYSAAFDRGFLPQDLEAIRAIGELVRVCVAVEDLWGRPVGMKCFGEGDGSPHPLRGLVMWAIGAHAEYRGTLGQFPGIKAGELSVRPDFDSEAARLWEQMRLLLGITLGVLLLNLLIYLPVRRALQPTGEILAALGRIEAGDLSVRLPDVALIELQKISTVFNQLVERLQHTLQARQQLAEHLLQVREAERRHLARELHDELGQCLASQQAEAAYVTELADECLPALKPSAEAIRRTTGHMMEALQQILRDLRPLGLEEFGLDASLRQLVTGWNARSHGRCTFGIEIDGEIDGFSDQLNVSVYRIVQESLSNASRHARADVVGVRLRHDTKTDLLEIDIEDNGVQSAHTPPTPGFGLLGMHERVLALGGRLTLASSPGGGTQVTVRVPVARQVAA